MEDEDDVLKPIDPHQSSSDPSPPEIPDQCGTASTVSAPTESSPAAAETEDKVEHPLVTEGLDGEGSEEVAVIEREHEGENASEQDANCEERVELAREVSEEQGKTDEIVKEEKLPPVTEVLEAKNEEVCGEGEKMAGEGSHAVEISAEAEGDKVVDADELPPVTDKVEAVTAEHVAGGDQEFGEGQEFAKQEENDSKIEEGDVNRQDEDESKVVEGDVKRQDEDESNMDADVDVSEQELKTEKQEDVECKEVKGAVDGLKEDESNMDVEGDVTEQEVEKQKQEEGECKDVEGDVKGPGMAKEGERESESIEGDVKALEVAKERERKSDSIEGDVKGQVVVNEEEDGSKRGEEVAGEKSEDKQVMEGDVKALPRVKQEDNEVKGDEEMAEGDQDVGGDGGGQLLLEQEEGDSKGVEGDVEGEVEVNQEDDGSKGDEEMGVEGEAEEMEDSQVNDVESSPAVIKDEDLTVEGGTPTAYTEMETEGETVKSGSGGKRRRGRNSKAAPARTPVRKTNGEDVCFICLDGGDLVLCDRRGCPKAYHPSCVDHDEEFFRTKDRWTCGWHLCNKCGKNAYFMCYTCTFSLCKVCCKDAVVFCVRGNRGFCESCMKAVMTIENSGQSEGQVAFDDKSSWEYLFKDYWMEQKRRFSISSEELALARNPWRSSDAANKQQMIGDVQEGNNDMGTDSDNSLENVEVTDSKRKKAKRKPKSVDSDTDSSSDKDVNTAKRKAKRRLKSQIKEAYSDSEHSSGNEDATNKRGKRPRRLSKTRSKDGSAANAISVNTAEGAAEWASKELLEFVMHMKDGDRSVLSQFDVQGLLLEYIKRNKLRDPRRRSQIICDPMLQKLFGKPRVGHFEMLKLLESHFLLKEDSQADDNHGNVLDEMSQQDADDNTDFTPDAGRSKGKKSRRRGEVRGLPSNLEDYAAIDMHNINLIYLRRNLLEALMEDSETFHDKVVGSFVRIRISGNTQKQDIYRLVQIIGTSKAAEPYRVGKRTTDVMLEILNLDKTEIISIDTISNQEFTEDECKRLRQSIKCGLISRMTVGDVLEKARELQEVRVTDWLEAEIVRLNHLRDRASEKGRKKELRECVEKLQVLKTPEERQRRLEEIPEVHADPKMDPSCESDDENEMDNRRQASNARPRESGIFRRDRDHFSARKGGSVSNDSWSANARPPNKNWELNRNLSGKGFLSRREDAHAASQTNEQTWNNGADKGTPGSWEKSRLTSDSSISTQAEYSGLASALEASQPPSSGTLQTDAKVNETEKVWHYRDPASKVQGPFSMTQLRKWSNTGYFPADLRIWKASQTEDDSILLTDALAGRFHKESPSVGLTSDISAKSSHPSIESSKISAHGRSSEYGMRYDSSSLPSPTPGRSIAGWGGKQASETKWSATSSSAFRPNNQFHGVTERLPSPTPTSPSSVPSGMERSNFSQKSRESGLSGNKEENPTASAVLAASVNNPTGQYFSTPAPKPAVSLNSGNINPQQISSQSAGHMANQAFAPADPGMSQVHLRPDANIAAQAFSNVVQPGPVPPNPSVYTQGWAPGSAARPELVNANMIPGNSNAIATQVPYSQWTGAPATNQASSYGGGYPPAPGNMAPNFPAMASHNAWRPNPPTNMPWAGQPQQPMNPNMGWTDPQSAAAAAFGGPSAGAMGQLVGPTLGASANTMTGWQGTGTPAAPTPGNTNPGWATPPGNASTWGSDQNRRGGGSGGHWGRQSSFGSGGGGSGTPRGQGVCKFHENGHCKKGAACNYMHT